MVPIHYEQEDPLQEEKEQDTQSGNLMAQGMNGVRSRLHRIHPHRLAVHHCLTAI